VESRNPLFPEALQAMSLRAFSRHKFLNTIQGGAVFMIEGRRLAGEAILDGTNIKRDRAGNAEAGCPTSRGSSEIWEAALEDLVREHSRLVYRIAYSVLRRHHDAEDATQETFMRVMRYSSKLAEVRDQKTWLAQIAWRVAVDRSKRQRDVREIALEDPEKPIPEIASSKSAADDTVQGTEISAVLEKLIAALPAKLRDPLVLSALEEMSPREVAETLGINEAAVRSRVFRARQMLKEKLAQRMSKQG
jgi:RNA polymerase sigma-70 factor, ECF subfamily